MSINLYAVSAPIPSLSASKGNRHRALPDIIFYPSDEEQFKNELLRTNKAHFILTYQSKLKCISTNLISLKKESITNGSE